MFFPEEKEPSPKDGEVRMLYPFAWKPTNVNGGVVWLERYVIRKRYFQPAGGSPGWWIATTPERLIPEYR